MAWNGSSNRLLCCYDEDDGIYYWDLTGLIKQSPDDARHSINSHHNVPPSNRFTHHHITATNSNETIEMCSVSWLAIPSWDGDADGVEEDGGKGAMKEYIVSLSHPFHLFICDLEGDIFASYSGFDGNIASHAICLPPLSRSHHNLSPTAQRRDLQSSNSDTRCVIYPHPNSADRSTTGWRPLSQISFTPSNGDSDQEGNAETWKEAQGNVSHPLGSRVVVVKSETCLQLFQITTNAGLHLSQIGTKSFPPYRFELVTELNISIPIITLSLVPLLGSSDDCHANQSTVLLLSCFDGPLKTIVVEVS
jgi:hypothetical protein